LPGLRDRFCPSTFLPLRHLREAFSLPLRHGGVWFFRRRMLKRSMLMFSNVM